MRLFFPSPTVVHRFRHRVFALALVVALLTPVGRLYAHDFWIEPTKFSAQSGDQVALMLRVGQDLSGDRLPYISDWFSDYRVVAPSETRPIDGVMGDDPAGTFDALEPGVHVVGYRSTRDFVEMEPEKFRSYLADEGLEHVVALRARRGESELPAREYYSRCAKALVSVDGVTAGAVGVNLGYTLELIPDANPYELRPGDNLPVRLLYLGAPIEGILVQAFTASTPDSPVALRTDAAGRVSIPLARPGLWLVKAVHIIETRPEVAQADWESYWASLTFEVAGPAAVSAAD